MDDSHELIEIIAGITLTLLGVVFAARLSLVGTRYDKALINTTATKQSVVQSYAYLDHVKSYNGPEVITNIVENEGLYVIKDGIRLEDEKINKARKGNETALTYLRNTFTDTYLLTYEYDVAGNIIGLNYSKE